MNKFLPFILSIFLTTSALYAQVFNWNTEDSAYVEFSNDNAIGHIYMTNVSGDSLLLDWIVLENTMPGAWEVTLCDYNTCYIGIPDSGSMKKLGDGDDGFFIVTMTAHGEQGNGVLQFYVYDKTDPFQGDTATFIISNTATGIANAKVNEGDIKIYPNPATDYINISGFEGKLVSARIFDVRGTEVLNQTTFNGSQDRISIVGLPLGVYVVKMIDDQNNTYHKSIVKH